MLVALEEGGLVGEEGGLRREFLIRRLMDITSSESISGFRPATMSSTRDRILSDRVWGEGDLARRTPRRGGLAGRGGGGDLRVALGIKRLEGALGALVVSHPSPSGSSWMSGTDKKNNTFFTFRYQKKKISLKNLEKIITLTRTENDFIIPARGQSHMGRQSRMIMY